MAITIANTPSLVSNVRNPFWFTFSSNNSTQTNFKFVIDVFTGSTGSSRVFRDKQFPAPSTNRVDFSPNAILRDYVQPGIYHIITASTAATMTLLNYSIQVSEEYGSGATGTTPAAGTEVSTTQATSGGNGRIGATTNLGKFNLNYVAGGTWNTETIDMTSYIGANKRLIFTWANDTSVGTNPPMAIDNITLSYTVNDAIAKDSDGYVTNRLIFSWVNNTGSTFNPPLSLDNIAVYCYPAVVNDKI